MLANPVGKNGEKESRESQKEYGKSGITVLSRGHLSKNWHKIGNQVLKLWLLCEK